MTTYLTPLSVIIGFVAWAVIQWKLGTKQAQAEATDNWKEAYESEKTLREQKEQQILQFNERIGRLEVKINAVEKENIGLTKEVNILKQVKPSAAFEEHIKNIYDILKKQNDDFLQHGSSDQEEFNKIWQRIETTNDVALDNNAMLKKLCKEG